MKNTTRTAETTPEREERLESLRESARLSRAAESTPERQGFHHSETTYQLFGCSENSKEISVSRISR